MDKFQGVSDNDGNDGGDNLDDGLYDKKLFVNTFQCS